MDDLAASLRAWRDRLSPAEAGLRAHARRRAPGLRRQEVAELAGLSVGYLTRLEQGSATNPSPLVLSALARALRLSTDEQALLFRLAGHAPPGGERMSRHPTPGVQRMLDRLEDLPVLVYDAAWEIVAGNPLAAALIGDPSELEGPERNIAWRHFTGQPGRIVHTAEESAVMDAQIVADLHAAAGRWPADERLAALIADLRRASPRFAALWEERPAAVHTSMRKTFDHPEVGRFTLDCDVLHVHGSDLRIVVYSAPPGSPDAEALALVGVVGLQAFSR
jgi:transcriptional regulator with XRE-family HTH domain